MVPPYIPLKIIHHTCFGYDRLRNIRWSYLCHLITINIKSFKRSLKVSCADHNEARNIVTSIWSECFLQIENKLRQSGFSNICLTIHLTNPSALNNWTLFVYQTIKILMNTLKTGVYINRYYSLYFEGGLFWMAQFDCKSDIFYALLRKL